MRRLRWIEKYLDILLHILFAPCTHPRYTLVFCFAKLNHSCSLSYLSSPVRICAAFGALCFVYRLFKLAIGMLHVGLCELSIPLPCLYCHFSEIVRV